MNCENCRKLTAIIDELSEMLANTQRSRREATRAMRALQKLLIMDIEEEHDTNSSMIALSQADGYSEN
jgi:hypothetical protein